MDVCRICLTKRPEKNILQLQVNKNDDKTTYVDIIMFCLNIQVEKDSKVSTKLCLKCHKKVLAFYKFKSLALKNDAYLRSLDVKNEVFINEEYIEIKSEELTMSDESQDSLVKEEPNDDTCLNAEDTDLNIESDDEFLSAIKKIKYEFVQEEIKENEKPNSLTRLDPEASEQLMSALPLPRSSKQSAANKKRKRNKTSSTGPNEKQMCEECGKTVTDLKAHSYLHLPVTERKRIKCHVCDKMFSSHSARYKHNKIKHLGVKQICNICNKAVTHLSQHKRVMHEKDSLQYECLECGRRFICNSVLDLHMRQHTKDRPFPCDACDKKFATKALMHQHKRSVHDKEKSHLCQLCSKSFFKKYHLQVHILSHSKEKTHECPECGKFYKTEGTLKSHRETHGDVRRFACQHCTQTFMKREYLVVHMLTHTKEKRHACQYCGVKFYRSDHRKRHEYTAHQKHLIATSTAST